MLLAHGAAGLDDLSGGILDGPVPVGVGTDTALAGQFDLIGRLFTHDAAYGPDLPLGKEGISEALRLMAARPGLPAGPPCRRQR